MLSKTTALIMLFLVVLCMTSSLSAQVEEVDFNINIVISMTGSAAIHRAEWGDPLVYEVLAVGDLVGNADVIDPAPGAEIRIQCSSGEVVVIAMQPAAPTLCAPLTMPDFSSLLRSAPSEAVQILYPAGRIANTRPKIRWQGIEEADRYNVRITRSNDIIVNLRAVEGEEADYPSDSDALVQGDYSIVIEPLEEDGDPITGKRSVTAMTLVSEGFFENINAVWKGRDFSLAQEGVDLYVRALLFADEGLYWDAITTMQEILDIDPLMGRMLTEVLPDSGTLRGSATPYLQLASWYLAIDLSEYATPIFEAALIIAQAYGQRENEATAIAALGELRPMSSRVEQYCALQRASDFFTLVLEDNALAQRVRDQMAFLVNSLGAPPEC